MENTLTNPIQTKLIDIGNSKGIRLNKNLLKQIGFVSEAILEVVGNRLILTPIKKKPREGWVEQIQDIQNKIEKEKLDIEYTSTQFDDKEWNW